MHHPDEKRLAFSQLFVQSIAKPRPRVLPIPIGHGPGKPQRIACFLDRKPAKEVELSDLGGGGVFLSESVQKIVKREDKVGIFRDRAPLIEQFDPYTTTDALLPVPVACMVHQDPPHRFGSGSEEMAFACKLLFPAKSKVSLMDQSGGVERVLKTLGRHLCRGKFSQFVIDKREQFRRGMAVSFFDGLDQTGYIRHEGIIPRPGRKDRRWADQSCRSDFTGSTRAALIAGTKAATVDIKVTKTGTPTRTSGV